MVSIAILGGCGAQRTQHWMREGWMKPAPQAVRAPLRSVQPAGTRVVVYKTLGRPQHVILPQGRAIDDERVLQDDGVLV